MSKLTRKINGEWDLSSLEGERKLGIVCFRCGDIVPLTYSQRAFGERFGYAIYFFCPSCFTGDREKAQTCRIG